MTVLRFPAGAAVGRIWWDGAGADRTAGGTVEVPDGIAVELTVGRSRYRGKKRHRKGLTAPMFRFAAALPALTELDWLDSSRGYGPTPPAEIERVRAMLPHISVCEPAR